jgi:type IV pilus assembly protein PilC
MARYTLKYATRRGEIREQVEEAASEQELRERYADRGFLVYSIQSKKSLISAPSAITRTRRKLNLEKFLIFNQQFVTLLRAGLPILKTLDLLADRLTDSRLAAYIRNVRDAVRNGALLSEAFRRQQVFPPIYVTSILAGEKSGSLTEVLDRYISYQKLALAVRKKILVSLLYPCLLVILVFGLVVFLITYVVPNFAQLYSNMNASLPAMTQFLIAVGTSARQYVLLFAVLLVAAAVILRFWVRTSHGRRRMDAVRLRTPIVGDIWSKYQVSQFARILGTLLMGGIPLVQALETAAESLNSDLLREALITARKTVSEGQSLSRALSATRVIPPLAVDMIEVGESTGALPAMLASVAEFFEDDVNIRMTAVLSLIEPAIMIFMGLFVAFVLVALYLPIFSLADTLR